MLRIRAGREGENGGAHGDIEFTNAGSRPCVLRGLPQAAIVQAGGKPLPVRLVRAPNRSLSPVVLAPGALDAADLVVFWANWCGRPPGPLSVRITMPAGGGVVTGPFNGPPDYSFVPQCPGPGQPSTISVTGAYQPGLAGQAGRSGVPARQDKAARRAGPGQPQRSQARDAAPPRRSLS